MKIKTLSISSFRGIPDKKVIRFDDSNEIKSAIIYGGNGSGKSSVVDALEFAVQARVGRSPSVKNPLRPSIFNLHIKESLIPEVAVTFEDDTTITRNLGVKTKKNDELSYYINPADPVESFDRAPIVLRRNDIIAFNNTKEAERQLLINQFIYKNSSSLAKLDDDPIILSLEEEVLRKKAERKQLIQLLSSSLKKDYDEVEDGIAAGSIQYCQSLVTHREDHSISRNTGKRRRFVSYYQYKTIISTAAQCDKVRNEIKDIQARISKQKKNQLSGSNHPITSIVEGVLLKSSQYLTSSFKEISNADYVKEINLSIGNTTQVSFNIEIVLTNGRKVSPTAIFSEANYDLMILLLYLSIIRVEVNMGQSPVLVLDDVLQSIDANIRTNFIDYILRELSHWQLIITCHDRLWLEQLKYQFNLRGHSFKEFSINNWSFQSGPIIIDKKVHATDETLKEAINTGNIRIIASMSGPFLEMICDNLSISLKCSVKRVPMDKYTLGDLWPAVRKSLSKTSVKPIAEDIDRYLYIRNLMGCHYNQWADSLSDDEVTRFANSIQSLYENVYCSKCFSWVRVDSSGKIISCNCNHLLLNEK